jgi:hypothetical protein
MLNRREIQRQIEALVGIGREDQQSQKNNGFVGRNQT